MMMKVNVRPYQFKTINSNNSRSIDIFHNTKKGIVALSISILFNTTVSDSNFLPPVFIQFASIYHVVTPVMENNPTGKLFSCRRGYRTPRKCTQSSRGPSV